MKRNQELFTAKRWVRRAAPLLALAMLGGGCNINKLTANTTSGMLRAGSEAVDRESDIVFAREAFPASLKTLETFLVNSPENEDLLLLLARGYNSYAFGFVEADLDRASVLGPDSAIESLSRRAKIFYLRGRAYAFRLLAEPDLEAAAFKSDLETLDAQLAEIEQEQAPALFWAAYGWASAINLAKDDPDMVAALPSVERMMKRAYELDPAYNGGAPTLFFGVYHTSKPKSFGGKPELAKQFFDEAIDKYSDNLLVPFLYARFYCPQVQDKKLWDEMLDRVLAADLEAYPPELRLTNEIARDRARFWKQHADDLILEH